MPRRRVIAKRELLPDALYGSPLVTKFINTIMGEGKRSTAERILYQSFDLIKERSGDDPLKIFKKAVDNVKPSLEVKSRRVGGSNYQVPARAATARRCRKSSPTSCSMPPTCAAAPSRSAKTRTAWRKRTRRSRTTAGSASQLKLLNRKI